MEGRIKRLEREWDHPANPGPDPETVADYVYLWTGGRREAAQGPPSGPRGLEVEELQRLLDVLRRLDTIGGLIPGKPLIQLQQQNVMVCGVTFADLLREAMDGAGA
jgi:hypothetical protein